MPKLIFPTSTIVWYVQVEFFKLISNFELNKINKVLIENIIEDIFVTPSPSP